MTGDDEGELDPHALRPGARLGKYTILRRFAVGGMAELYLAKAKGAAGFEKVFALKRVRPVLASDREFLEMFLRESRIAASLDHPNIAKVIDVGQVGVDYFFVMEFVHGESLRKVLREAAGSKRVPLECAVAIVHATARALHYAHGATTSSGEQLEIVHRDVSPSNVLVSFQGEVKVVDFGIAKALAETRQTRAGVLKGKVGYMSPEQCIGDEVDRRSDVFGLGILLYEATTCERLFTADSQFAVMNKIMRGTFAPPREVVEGFPADLEAVILRALSVDPNARQQTAEELQVDLERVVEARGDSLSPRQLEEMMRDLFGDRPAPRPALPKGVVARNRRRTALVAVPIGVAALAGVAWLAQPHSGTTTSGGANSEHDELAPPVAAAPSKAALPERPEAAAVDPAPPAEDAAPESDASPSSAPVAKPARRKKKKGRKVKQRRKKPLFPEGL